jgi:amino acid permease
MASDGFSTEKEYASDPNHVKKAQSTFDAESPSSQAFPREVKLVRQLKNRHIAMIRFVDLMRLSLEPAHSLP